jgi:hypothetical protein
MFPEVDNYWDFSLVGGLIGLAFAVTTLTLIFRGEDHPHITQGGKPEYLWPFVSDWKYGDRGGLIFSVLFLGAIIMSLVDLMWQSLPYWLSSPLIGLLAWAEWRCFRAQQRHRRDELLTYLRPPAASE